MASLSSYGGKLSNFGNTGTTAATPDGIDELILAMGGWKTNGASTITPSIVMSRTGNGTDNPELWVAPCAVVFDATGTTKTGETEPLENLLYSWDFGDTAKDSEYWEYGARPGTQSKNRDLGYIAGHVYDVPGEYTITLTVLGADGSINTATQTITVTDPDVIFAGDKTICFSNDADFTGAPTGSVQVTTSTLDDVTTRAAAGKRYLFKRGHTFDRAVNTTMFSNLSNVQFGSFGTGNLPKLRATAAGASCLYVFGNNGIVNNYQFYDLEFVNVPLTTDITAVRVVMPTSLKTITSPYGLMTFYRIKTTKIRLPGLSGNCNAVVECYGDVLGTGGAVGMFGSDVHDSMWLGNYCNNHNTAEHTSRIQGGQRNVLAHNHYANPAATKHNLTIRGSAASTGGEVIPTFAINTQYTYGNLVQPITPNGFIYIVSFISGNRTTGESEPTWPTTIGDEVVSGNVTFKCEYVDTTATTGNATPAYYVSKHYVVRDNYFDTTGITGAISYIVAIHPQGTSNYEPISDILFEGNAYSAKNNLAATFTTGLYINASRIIVRNNLFNLTLLTEATDYGIDIANSNSSGMPNSTGVHVYNNSFYIGNTFATNKELRAVNQSDALALGLIVKNNIFYVRDASPAVVKMVLDSSTDAVIANNSTDLQAKTVNPFITTNPSSIADFKLASNSYARSAGVNVDSSFLDFYGTAINRQSVDMGAISKDS